MKKLFLVTLILATAFLVSCNATEVPEISGTQATETAAPSDGGALQMVNENGKTDYSIIISENAGSRVRTAVGNMRSYFVNAFGTQIFMKEDANTEEKATEILIGQTNRPESAAALAALEKNSYSITVNGSKIVIAATSDEGLESAIELFVNIYLKNNPEGQLLNVSSHTGSLPDCFDMLEAGWNDMRGFSYTDHIDINYRIYKPKDYDS
ncbi:MAG: hypothetical protein IJN63_03845, partial [Clostridia bacterium]|nr:hypothetical protein [Clostridia bacterium]